MQNFDYKDQVFAFRQNRPVFRANRPGAAWL